MENNKVLAVVEGREITEADVNLLLQSLGPQQGAQFNSEEGKKQLLEELINQQLFYIDAKEKNLDQEEAFKMELEKATENLLKQYAIRNLLSDIKVTEQEVTDYYNEHKDQFNEPEQLGASHILVDDEEKAKEIKEEIDNGLAFEEAAKKYSNCPSKERGGDLGFFAKGRMVPEFEEAAFNMEENEVSEPVKTQFGYHLIKVTGKKEASTKTLGEVGTQIQQTLVGSKQNKAYLEKSSELRGKYNVEVK